SFANGDVTFTTRSIQRPVSRPTVAPPSTARRRSRSRAAVGAHQANMNIAAPNVPTKTTARNAICVEVIGQLLGAVAQSIAAYGLNSDADANDLAHPKHADYHQLES